MYKRANINFTPIAFDSNGAIGQEADFFLKQLATQAVQRNPDMDWAGPALRAGWVQLMSLTVHVRLSKPMPRSPARSKRDLRDWHTSSICQTHVAVLI